MVRSEEYGSSLVSLRRRRNLRCKNLAKTRDWLSGNLELVAAPFSRFFIANTLHHRLLAGVLFVSCGCGVRWGGGGAWRCFYAQRLYSSAMLYATKNVAASAIFYWTGGTNSIKQSHFCAQQGEQTPVKR